VADAKLRFAQAAAAGGRFDDNRGRGLIQYFLMNVLDLVRPWWRG